MCRICLETDDDDETVLICPCDCTGSMGHVHVHCLNAWCLASQEQGKQCRCEVCKAPYTPPIIIPIYEEEEDIVQPSATFCAPCATVMIITVAIFWISTIYTEK
jgi:E3 ubiquitin-protein ligase DOA10